MDSQRKPERYLPVKTLWGRRGLDWGDDTIRRSISRQVVRAVILPRANSKNRSRRRIRIPKE